MRVLKISVKNISEVVVIVQCIVMIYRTKDKIKKMDAKISNLAAEFIHEAEITGDSGEQEN